MLLPFFARNLQFIDDTTGKNNCKVVPLASEDDAAILNSLPDVSAQKFSALPVVTKCFGTERFGKCRVRKKKLKKKNRSDLPTQTFLAMLPETDYFFFWPNTP